MNKRKRIKRKFKNHNERMMALTKKINDKRKQLTKQEQASFYIRLELKHGINFLNC